MLLTHRSPKPTSANYKHALLDIAISFDHRLGSLEGQFDDGASVLFVDATFDVDELLGDADKDAVSFEEGIVGRERVETRKVFDVTGSSVEASAVPRAADRTVGVCACKL